MNHQLTINQLKSWFQTEKRDLPWRQTSDPYAIWVSEIMLQQTQVLVVIPYFLNWMERFPSISHLASAALDDVIKTWEGLGYYSRARHLHEAANYLVQHHQGKLPNQEEELKKIKGLGPYTIGAILSFAFHQKKVAVDGNVIRVLTRYFGLKDDISKSATIHQVRELAYSLLPEEESWIINEALIELGATICQRKPRCHECPMKNGCVSFTNGSVEGIPFNSKKIKIEYLYRSVAVIQSDSHFLVKRGEKGAIMSDLYEFPYFEGLKGGISSCELAFKIKEYYGLDVKLKFSLKEVNQGFTRYQATLYPALFTCQKPKEIEGFVWLPFNQLQQLAFSSGHRRTFQQIQALLEPV